MKLAIFGATGVVGQIALNLIEEYKIDFEELFLFASKKSKGRKIKVYNKEYEVELFDNKICFDYALMCVGNDVSKMFVPFLLESKVKVIDCSSFFRKDNYPLIAYGVNEQEINESNLICTPNCVVMQIILPLFEISKEYNIKSIDVVSFQSVSGSGKKGIDDLINKTNSFYPYDINKTCIPLIGKLDENGFSKEENKISFELNKILKTNISVYSTCVRVPIERCHGVSLKIELDEDISVEKTIEIISRNPFCKHREIPNAIEALNNDFVYFGRVRKSSRNTILMYVIGDNLRRGAAGNACMILKHIKNN